MIDHENVIVIVHENFLVNLRRRFSPSTFDALEACGHVMASAEKVEKAREAINYLSYLSVPSMNQAKGSSTTGPNSCQHAGSSQAEAQSEGKLAISRKTDKCIDTVSSDGAALRVTHAVTHCYSTLYTC